MEEVFKLQSVHDRGYCSGIKRALITLITFIVVGVVVYYLTQGRGVFAKKQAPELGMTLDEFGKQYASLEGRFREREEFIQRATGKKVHWVVVFRSPGTYGDRIIISFGSETNPFAEPVSTGDVSITAKDRIYALRRGDMIKIDGILKAYVPTSLTVEISDFEFVRPASEKRSEDSSRVPEPIATTPSPEALGMTLEQFDERYQSLDGRFGEQESFLRNADGKKIEWTVQVSRVTSEDIEESIIVSFDSRQGAAKKGLESIAGVAQFPKSDEQRLFSLRKGDVIKIRGTLTRAGRGLAKGLQLRPLPECSRSVRTRLPASSEKQATRLPITWTPTFATCHADELNLTSNGNLLAVTLAGCQSRRRSIKRATRRAAIRVKGPVQIATDNFKQYPWHIREAFGYEGFGYGMETKVFGEPQLLDGTLARLGKNEGVRKMLTAERKAVIGSPDLGSLTTSHIERVFLSVRQELKRFQRKGLGYSKDLETHKLAVALFLGVYNFVRVHKTLETTPAVAAGVELERWDLERAVEMTTEYLRRKEDVKFEEAFAAI